MVHRKSNQSNLVDVKMKLLSAHTYVLNSNLLTYQQSHKRMSSRGKNVEFTCLKQQMHSHTQTHRPLSSTTRPVIFPPLILDVSAKWEVKSQIWDVTFSLPPCLLPPSLPSIPLSLHRSPVLFCTSLFDCNPPPTLSPTWCAHSTHSAPIWVMAVYRHVELMDFIQSIERLIWA